MHNNGLFLHKIVQNTGKVRLRKKSVLDKDRIIRLCDQRHRLALIFTHTAAGGKKHAFRRFPIQHPADLLHMRRVGQLIILKSYGLKPLKILFIERKGISVGNFEVKIFSGPLQSYPERCSEREDQMRAVAFCKSGLHVAPSYDFLDRPHEIKMSDIAEGAQLCEFDPDFHDSSPSLSSFI